MSALTLRDYQHDCIDALRAYRGQALAKGTSGRAGVVLPMGTGKSVVIGAMAPMARKRMLVLAHREEILEQNAAKIRAAVGPDVSVGIDQAGRKPNMLDKIIVASVQTIWRPQRLQWYPADEFSLVVVDECHHIVARTWLTVLQHFGLAPEFKDLTGQALAAVEAQEEKVLKAIEKEARDRFATFVPGPTAPFLVGYTATPGRSDGRGLGAVLDDFVYERDLMWGIDSGWLAPARGMKVETGVDITGVKTRRGPDGRDFVQGELTQALNTEARNALIVDTHLQHCPERQGIVFCAGVAHVQGVVSAFQERRITVAGVTAETPREIRRQIRQDFLEKRLQVVVNCNVYTEGTDLPAIGAVHMARATLSSLVYTQSVGRGARVDADLSSCGSPEERRAVIAKSRKPDFIVFDYADAAKVGVQSLNTLFGLPPNLNLARGIVPAVKAMKDVDGKVPADWLEMITDPADLQTVVKMFDPLARAMPEQEIARVSDIAWTKVPGGYYLRMMDKGTVAVLVGATGCAVQVCLKGRAPFYVGNSYRHILDAIGAADRWLRQTQPDLFFYKLDAPWRRAPISVGQKRYLDRLKVAYPPNCNKGHAQQLIDASLWQRDAGIKQAARCPKCGERAAVGNVCLRCEMVQQREMLHRLTN